MKSKRDTFNFSRISLFQGDVFNLPIVFLPRDESPPSKLNALMIRKLENYLWEP